MTYEKQNIHSSIMPSTRFHVSFGFTLVELIVVVTILAILATIGFVSYSSYLTGVRDTNRLAQLVSIHGGMELYKTTNDLPLPDDNVEVQVSSATIAYQGYAGSNTLETIDFTKGGKDPKDNVYFSYYLTKDRRNFQMLAYLEEEESLQVNNLQLTNQLFAIDYSDRVPIVYGRTLGILTDSSNTPIQEISDITTAGKIDLMSYTTNSTAHFQDDDIFTGTGKLLYAIMKHKALKKISPTDCPDGFIPVPGNPELDQEGFCVAKYEMTYNDATIPDATSGGTDLNTVTYNASKRVVSEADKYPIADITQAEAISSCQSMGKGYHLITNKERITIARNIELQKENWSNGTTGSGFIFNGNSNDAIPGCNDNTGPRAWGTTTGGVDARHLSSSRTSCDEKRQLILSNDEIVWDMSGNVQEHVNKADTLDGNGFDAGINPDIGATNNSWAEWSESNTSNLDRYGPLLSIWDATNGMGRIWQANGTIFTRGSDAYGNSYAGLFALRTGFIATHEHSDTGFRCAR